MPDSEFLKAVYIVVGGWLSLQFAIRKFRQERQWSRKEEEYSRILREMHDLLFYHDEWFDDYVSTPENPSTEWSKRRDDRMARLLQKSKEAEDSIRRVSEIGAFFVSEDVVNELTAMRKAIVQFNGKLWRSSGEYDPIDAVQDISATVNRHLQSVRQAMLVDLGMKSRFWNSVSRFAKQVYAADYHP